MAAARQHRRDGAGREIVDHDKIGAPTRRDEPAIVQTKNARGGKARGAIGGERRRAQRNRGADDEVEMALLGDVERIAVVGAEGEERRMALGDDRRQRVQVLRHRALAHQDLHALGELFQRLGDVGRLVIGADAGGEIAVEVEAAKQRAVAVDPPVLERGEFGETGRIARQHAGEIHEFGEAEHFGMSANGSRSSTSSRAPDVSRWVAGTQLDNCTRRSIAVAIEASRK